jgi:hypothetical protein
MLRDRVITLAQAKRALTFSTWSGISFEDTLIACGIHPSTSPHDNRLGRLLAASGCLGESEAEHYAAASQFAGMQLGQFLVLRKQLSQSMLEVSLETLKLVRAGSLTYEQAIAGLRAIQLALEERTTYSDHKVLPLGKLIVNAGIISEREMHSALEVARINSRPLGQVLLIFAMISEKTLMAALELQSLMRSNRLRAHCAVKALSLIFTHNISVLAALASVHDVPVSGSGSDISLSGFLKRTGLFHRVAAEIESFEQGAPQMHQLHGLRDFVDEDQLRMAVRCTFLIRRSIITFEQALLAFHHSTLNGCDIDDFLFSAGWIDYVALSLIDEPKAERRLKAAA